MNKKGILYWFLCLLVLVTACNDDNCTEQNLKLTENIEKDIIKRFPDAVINSVRSYDNDIVSGIEVHLTDRNTNDVSVFYSRDICMLTVCKIRNFHNLPYAVKSAFAHSMYGTMNKEHINGIECIEYYDLNHAMYKIDFTYFVPGTGELYTLLMFNEDGYMLPVIHHSLNNPWWHKSVNLNQKNFIVSKYGADIRAYHNDGGYDCFYVLDGNKLKYVSFCGNQWKSTTYDVPVKDVPSGVKDVLYESYPDFKYTQVSFIESPEKNVYQFLNDDGKGYFVDAYHTGN